MEKIKVIELFGGISAPTKALINLKIPFQVVDYVENDKNIVKIRNDLFGTNYEPKSVVDYHYDGEVDLLIGGSPCLVGNTRILTKNGYIPIKDIKIGEKVLTHNLRWEKVNAVLNQGIKDTWKLNLTKNVGIEATSNHKFYIYDIKEKEFKWLELEKINIEQHYITKPIYNNTISESGESFKNKDFWYVVGQYLGNGWTTRRNERNNNLSSVVIACNKEKADYIKGKIEKVFHISADTNERTTRKLTITNKKFAEFLNDNFGHGALNKFIHPNILLESKENLMSLLMGYTESDGAKNKNGLSKYTSVSKKLLMGMELISLKCGIKTSLSKDFREPLTTIENRIVKQHNTYQLRQLTTKNIMVGNYYCVKIQSITKTNIQKEVFDLTIENDHSFVAENIIVHNCQDFSLAGLGAGGEQGSQTRSSLIWEQLRILKETMPKYYIWENVKAVITKKHKPIFDKHNQFVESLGYKVKYSVLNARNFEIPQNRERVFVVAIRKDIVNNFEFWKLQTKSMRLLKEFLETPRLKDYVREDKHKYITKRVLEQKVKLIDYEDEDSFVGTLTTQVSRGKLDSGAILELVDPWYYIKKTTKSMVNNDEKNMKSFKTPSGIDKAPIYTTNHENYIYDEKSNRAINTIPATGRTAKIIEQVKCIIDKELTIDGESKKSIKLVNPNFLVIKFKEKLYNVRVLTERECYLLMGFSEEDFNKVQHHPRSQLYKTAGNSIVVNVLMAIFKELFINGEK